MTENKTCPISNYTVVKMNTSLNWKKRRTPFKNERMESEGNLFHNLSLYQKDSYIGPLGSRWKLFSPNKKKLYVYFIIIFMNSKDDNYDEMVILDYNKSLWRI